MSDVIDFNKAKDEKEGKLRLYASEEEKEVALDTMKLIRVTQNNLHTYIMNLYDRADYIVCNELPEGEREAYILKLKSLMHNLSKMGDHYDEVYRIFKELYEVK